MNIKQTVIIVVIVLLVILASYLFFQKGIKCGEVCPVTPAVKQSAPPPARESKIASAGIKVTFVELGSVGCAPCDMMQPILDEIEKEYDGQVLVRFWNVKSLLGAPYAEKYRVQSIPTQVFLDKDGNEYYRHIGFFPKEEIIKVLELQGVK